MFQFKERLKQGRRALVTGCLGLAIMSIPALASAELHYQVGLKGFQTDTKITFGTDTTLKSDNSAWLAGPSVKVMGDTFFAGATYLVPTEKLEFEDFLKIERQDLDIFVGMMPLKGDNFKLGLVLGYKGIFLDYDLTDTDEKAKSDFHGGMFGMPMSYRLPIAAVPIVVYATPAYGYLRETFQVENFDEEKTTYFGYSIDAGVSVGIWRGLAASLGYKYQNMDSETFNTDPDKEDQKFEFKGITFGVDYTF